MAKKIIISDISESISKKNKKKKAIIIIISIIIFAIIASLVGIIIYCNGEISNLKKTILVEEDLIESLEDDYEDVKNDLHKLTLLDSVDYVKNKLDFFDQNIVFKIKGYGNKYYTYDCMMKKVGNDSYEYWGYNTEAAISEGLKKGSC